MSASRRSVRVSLNYVFRKLPGKNNGGDM